MSNSSNSSYISSSITFREENKDFIFENSPSLVRNNFSCKEANMPLLFSASKEFSSVFSSLASSFSSELLFFSSICSSSFFPNNLFQNATFITDFFQNRSNSQDSHDSCNI